MRSSAYTYIFMKKWSNLPDAIQKPVDHPIDSPGFKITIHGDYAA